MCVFIVFHAHLVTDITEDNSVRDPKLTSPKGRQLTKVRVLTKAVVGLIALQAVHK